MSDLEQRLTEALSHGAEGAPAASGLADAARSRARSRRRGRVTMAAAAVALCVAVPTAVVAARGSDRAGAGPSDHPTATTSPPVVPTGERLESWHGVSVLVPDWWGYGNLDDWCANGGQITTSLVQRPDAVSEDIRCDPRSTYGLTFQAIDNTDDFEWPTVQQTGRAWAPHAFVGGRAIGGVLVMVAAPTRDEALNVLATMRAIGPEGDANGCTVGSGTKATVDRPDGAMSVCRYDADGLLEQSELLTGKDATAAEQALRAAQVDARKGPACEDPHAPTTVIRMLSSDVDASVGFGSSCWSDNRILVGEDPYLLDSSVLYWALSPGWSGSFPEGVSLPSELRMK